MSGTRLERFLKSIGYPDRISDGSSSFAMRVDEMEIVASEANGRIVLMYSLSGDSAIFPTLAAYAPGRFLREDAVLAYGKSSAFLWQDAPADAGEHELSRLFETFANSCDWWRERVEASSEEKGAELTEAVIRP